MCKKNKLILAIVPTDLLSSEQSQYENLLCYNAKVHIDSFHTTGSFYTPLKAS